MPAYFRIVVKRNDQFFFRTSRLRSTAAMLNARNPLLVAFPADEGYTVEVLSAAEFIGKVLSNDEINELITADIEASENASENAKFL